MAAVILLDCWCEDTMQGDYSPAFWHSLARFEKALNDGNLKPVRIVSADRHFESDIVFVHAVVACEPGHDEMPFWKWWLRQDATLSQSSSRNSCRPSVTERGVVTA